MNFFCQEQLVFCQVQINFIAFKLQIVSVTVQNIIQLVCVNLDFYTYFSRTILYYCPFYSKNSFFWIILFNDWQLLHFNYS